MSPRRSAAHGAARWVVRIAALRVPGARRERMTREWGAELEREFGHGGGWGVFAAAFGAFADAATTRRLERDREGMMTMGERMSGWTRDVSVSVRSLLRTPGFTAVAVLTLAVGLGGSAAIFTLLDRVVFDPLPYPDADRLVRLENRVPGVDPDQRWSFSTAEYLHVLDNAETLDRVGLYQSSGGNVVTPTGAQRASLMMTTASTMELLGTEAVLGRVVTEADDVPGAPNTVVLSNGFWARAYGSDPDIVGTSLPFNDVPMEIIGVLEPGVEVPGWSRSMAPDIWMPIRLDREGSFGNNHALPAIARMAEGATVESVQEELTALNALLPEEFPNVYQPAFMEQYGFTPLVTALKEHVVADLASVLWVLFGGIGLVLLIAVGNVASLFLVRMEGKRREIDIRRALGADRGTIGRYLAAEGMTLAVAGGVLALAVAFWAVPVMTAMAPDGLPRIEGTRLGLGTVGFTLLLSLAIGLGVAMVPTLGRQASGPASDGGRGSTVGRERHRVRSGLVIAQMALAVALIVGAGDLVQTLRALSQRDTGMDPAGSLAVSLYMNPHTYPEDIDLWIAYEEILSEVSRIPGVLAVGMGEEIPVSGGYGCTVQGFDDQSVYDRIRDAGLTTCAGQTRVTPGYFEALGIPLVEGRYLELGDHTDPSRAAVVVSQAFADRFWPGENALGKTVGPSGRSIGQLYRVVGVVGDVASRSDPPLSEEAMAIYYPTVHNPDATGNWGWWWPGNMTLVVRTGLDDPMSLVGATRDVVVGVDPSIPMSEARSLESIVAEAMGTIAFISLLLAIAAAVALTLAAVGLYGVVAYVVSKRTREIGTRLAIGADPGAVVRQVVTNTLKLVGIGLALGIPLALSTSRVGQSLLVGLEPTTPAAYAVAVLLLTTVAFGAAWLPARRAARVDPVTALRAE